jgi:hypothetical protein
MMSLICTGIPGLQPTIGLSLLVAAELGSMEEGEATSYFFLLFDGTVGLSDEAVEGFIKNTLNLTVVIAICTPRVQVNHSRFIRVHDEEGTVNSSTQNNK